MSPYRQGSDELHRAGAAQADLGRLVERLRPASLVSFAIAGFAIWIAAVGVVFVARPRMSAAECWVGFLIGATMFVVMIAQMRAREVRRFERGLIVAALSSEQTVMFEHIEDVRDDDGRLAIVTREQRRVLLDGMANIVPAVIRACAEPFVRAAGQHLAAGAALSFGRVTVDRDAILAGWERRAWLEIESIVLGSSSFTVRSLDETVRPLVVKYSKVSKLHLLVAVFLRRVDVVA